ncbi:MAG: LptF/LptG family permease [Bdellovibrionota bacterium]
MIFFYFLKEVIPQFISTLIVFCSIIIISQLVRLSEVLIAFGLTAENILLPFLYIIMPFMTIIIPISFLFAVMVAFSRISADGEFFALLSAGYSLRRAAMPILVMGGVLYLIGGTSAMYLEAWGRREFVQFRYRKTQTELDNMIKFKMQEGVFLDDFIGYVIYAEHISRDRSKFTNVMLSPKEGKSSSDTIMIAPKAQITGSVESGDLRMVF